MGNQAGIIIRNVKNELFHSAKRLILNEVKGIECLQLMALSIYGYPNEMLKNMTFHYEMSERGWLPLYVMVGVGMPLLFAFLCKTIQLKIIRLFKK